MEAVIKDSGVREDFSTGSVRDTREGKGRYDLISPIFTERLAKHLELGAAKYDERNWEKGQEVSRCMDSCKRHLNKYLEGHRDEDHLAAAVTNLMFIIHTEEMVRRNRLPATLIDWPNYLAEWETETEEASVPSKPHPNLPNAEEGWRYTGEFRVPGGDWFLCDAEEDGLLEGESVTFDPWDLPDQPAARWILEKTDV